MLRSRFCRDIHSAYPVGRSNLLASICDNAMHPWRRTYPFHRFEDYYIILPN